MKLFHGSPKKLKILKPMQAKGQNEFENQKAVFLTKAFKHAALYAIGKTLKGKAVFAVTPDKLIIVGSSNPRQGYVLEVEVREPIKGPKCQFASKSALEVKKSTLVYPKDCNIIHVGTKSELMELLE